jgi:hypothetical protein
MTGADKPTQSDEFPDTAAEVEKAFLRAVVSAPFPIKARKLNVPGLSREAVQARLERLRIRAGHRKVDDASAVERARLELTNLMGPEPRGLERLKALGDPDALEFARAAGLQGVVIGDWVELAHSPDDLGWTRDDISVVDMPRSMLFDRGKAQSWLSEKKAFLREEWKKAKVDPALKRSLVPNRLKADLVGIDAWGSRDSRKCVIRLAPVDWLTCASLNARLKTKPAASAYETVRERWCEPAQIAARRALPGMLVGHIVVETADQRFIVCQRATAGMHDEPGTWSISLEERWSGARTTGQSSEDDADAHPHDLVGRAVRDELGVVVSDDDIRILSWGIEDSVLYPGFIAIARTSRGSWELEGLRQQAPDANEISFVSAIPAGPESLELLDETHFAPKAQPGLERRWHRTSKARLFAALAHVRARAGGGRWELIRWLGGQTNPRDRA